MNEDLVATLYARIRELETALQQRDERIAVLEGRNIANAGTVDFLNGPIRDAMRKVAEHK